MNPIACAKLLHTRGWVVVPAYSKIRRVDLDATVKTFPEYADHPSFDEVDSARRYTCGSTAFCGSPSFSHHQLLRKLRDMTFLKHQEMFQEYAKLLGDGVKIGRWIDRTMIRPPGESPSAESWHQDSPAHGREGERWTGGWINFDAEDQHFAAVAGTHTNGKIEGGGFQAIDKSQHADFNARLKAQAGKEGYDDRGFIVVPPNHLLVFNSTIVHKVNPSKKATTSVKTFFGLRFTTFDDSGIFPTKPPPKGEKRKAVSYDEIRKAMRSNAVMYLPSGQTPVMYPASYLNFPDKQLHYYEEFERDMLKPGAMKPLRDPSGKILHKMHKYYDDTRAMRSLEEQGLPLHQPYHPSELDLMVPKIEPEVLDWETGEVVTCKRARP